VREGGEVSVGERQPVVVVANVEILAQSLGQALDEAELAAVRASTNGRRLQLDAKGFAIGPFDLKDDILARRKSGFDQELVIGRQELPIQEIRDLAAVDGQELGPRLNPQLFGDAAFKDS